MNSLVYLNGLSGWGPAEQNFESRELAKFAQDGINSEHMLVQWHGWAKVDGVIDGIEARVRQLAELGDVSIVGFSAGGSAALHVFDRTKDIEGITATSIAGRLTKGVFHNFSPWHLNHASHKNARDPNTRRYPAFFDSVVRLEREVLPSMSDQDKSRLTILKPMHDFVVPLSTMEVAGVDTVIINAHTHYTAGVKGIRYIRRQMQLSDSKR